MKTKILWPVLVTVWLVVSPTLAAADEPRPYTVQPGDTLIRIGARTGVPVSSLVEANRAAYPCLVSRPACLQIGWRLTLPKQNSPTPMAADSIAPTPAGPGTPFGEMRTALANGLNQIRLENGLSTLTWSDPVAAAAQQRSQDMAARNYFSHFDPVTGQIAAAQLLPGSAYSPACENIYGAWGRAAASVPDTALTLWWNSPSHRQCLLLARATVMGIGIAQDSRGGWLVSLINARPR